MYNYQNERSSIFTEEGSVRFTKIRDHVLHRIRYTGAIDMHNAMCAPGTSGDTWKLMACVDRLVELGELREVKNPYSECGQDRLFVPPAAS